MKLSMYTTINSTELRTIYVVLIANLNFQKGTTERDQLTVKYCQYCEKHWM